MPDRNPPPLLEAGAITKYFGAVTALQDVNLSLWKGEVLGVVGDKWCREVDTNVSVVRSSSAWWGNVDIRWQGSLLLKSARCT